MNSPYKKTENISSEILPQVTLSEEIFELQDFRDMNRFMFMIMVAAILPWLIGQYTILYFNVTGWAWVLPMIIAGLICLKKIKHITFPFGLWLFWAALLFVYWFLDQDNPNALQSFFQMLAPVIIGCAASTYRADKNQLENIVQWMSYLAWIAWIILIIRLPMILVGALPGHGFMAPEMIGLLFFGACYATFYACGSYKHLYYYLSMLLITFVALVRGPITSMISCLPLTFAPLGIRKRLIFIILAIICAITIFNTDRVQQRMFQSGSGEVSDIRLNNPNFRTNARAAMWDILWEGVYEEPWFGNGWNDHRVQLIRAGFPTYAPHNDWLKILHDMGICGVSIYLLLIVIQIFFLVRIARWSTGAHQMLAYSAATAFIPYMLIMFTDNVVLYVQFFGNPHFALIGIVYGAMFQNDN